jgi:phenylpropionate dioxygenase-like ring-hydroxylating dioxygenase large terminal subunit
MTSSKDIWQAAALVKDVRRQPLRLEFGGEPVVLFNSGTGITALADRCPHRLMELSKGKVVGGEIECPYHGWRFDGSGRCTTIPGHLGDVPGYRIPGLKTFVKDGVVFLSRGDPAGEPYLHPMEGRKVLVRLVRSSTRSTLIDTAENILDATHTHFTHKGLLRGLSSKRHRVRVDITGGPGWVEAVYTGEDRQHGLISKLLEAGRVRTVGRYRFPGIAELEYWGENSLALATTFHLRQAADGRVEGIGCLIGPHKSVLDRIKSWVFQPMFRIALEQDRRVLTSSLENAARFPDARPLIGPLDYLRRDIEAIE